MIVSSLVINCPVGPMVTMPIARDGIGRRDSGSRPTPGLFSPSAVRSGYATIHTVVHLNANSPKYERILKASRYISSSGDF